LISEGKLPTNKVYEDENFIGALDIFPAKVGQIVLFPKAHIKYFKELPQKPAESFFGVAHKLLIALKTLFVGVNILVNEGKASGQRLEHISLNIIPREEGDKVNFYWQPIQAKDEELKKIKEKIIVLIPREVKITEQKVIEEKPTDFSQIRIELEKISRRLP